MDAMADDETNATFSNSNMSYTMINVKSIEPSTGADSNGKGPRNAETNLCYESSDEEEGRQEDDMEIDVELADLCQNVIDGEEDDLEQNVNNVQKQEDINVKKDKIRAMCVPMGQKRTLNRRLRNFKIEQRRAASVGSMRQHELGCWTVFKLRTAMAWDLFKDKVENSLLSLQLWRGHLKEVEGKFGNGVLSYFLFLKSLLMLNIVIFFIELLLVVPQALINYDILVDFPKGFNKTPAKPRPDYVTNRSVSALMLDFFTGQGFINTTIMFYSNYYGKIVAGTTGSMTYHMPLAYIVVSGGYMVISFLMMARNFSERFKESILESSDVSHSYCSKVFASWDYCVVNEKTVDLKMTAISQDFEAELEEDERLKSIAERTRCGKFKIYMIRVICNILAVSLLGGAVFAIFESVKISTTDAKVETDTMMTFLRRWASPLTITASNLILPTLFDILTNMEQYSPQTTIVMSLWRAVVLKLASLVVLMVTLYGKFGHHTCDECWENHIAAQMFNLIIVDFIVTCAVTIIKETSRKYASKYFKCKICGVIIGDKIGRAEFKIPKNILDLVYGQALIWIGTFFAPLLPVLGIIKLFITFYVKKISLVFNCKSSSKSFQAAKSNYFITLLLLMTFVMCTVAIGHAVTQLKTSRCGPYSNTMCDAGHFMINIIEKTIDKWPEWISSIISFLKTIVFLFLLFTAIFLLLYYYHAKTMAHEKMIHKLQDRLKIEGRARSVGKL